MAAPYCRKQFCASRLAWQFPQKNYQLDRRRGRFEQSQGLDGISHGKDFELPALEERSDALLVARIIIYDEQSGHAL